MRTLISLLLICFTFTAFSQFDPDNIDVNALSTNPKQYGKAPDATKLSFIKKQNWGVWYGDGATVSGSGTSFTFDVNYCYIYFSWASSPTTDQEMIDERVDALQSVYKNFKIDTLEYRIVNGEKMIFLHCQGDYSTSHQVISGYYKAYPTGNIRIYTVVVEDSFKKNKRKIYEVLNGLAKVTEDEIKLAKTGIDPDNVDVYELTINPLKFTKSADSKKLLKMKKRGWGVWYNNKEVTKSGKGDYYTFSAGYCSIYFSYSDYPTNDQDMIDERIDALQSVYKNFVIDTLEYRKVNGEEFLFLHCQGDYSTTHQIISGYYKAYPEGNIRIYTVAVEDNYKKYKKQVYNVLNSIVKLK